MSKKNYCSPGSGEDNISCFSLSSLKKIATNWNNDHSNNPIKLSSNKQILWNRISEKMQKVTKCPSEICWLDSKYTNNVQLTDFKPARPLEWEKNNNTWLSTLDIANVLNQYHKKHKDFQFIGPVPIDFDSKLSMGKCVVEEMCKINFEKLFKNGKRKLGIVFNLDPHYKSGSHWVSLFIDFKTGGIYYFDSYGYKPNLEITNFMKKMHKQGNMFLKKHKKEYDKLKDDHVSIDEIEIISKNKIKVSEGLIMYLHENDLLGFVISNKKCKEKTMCGKIKEVIMVKQIDYANRVVLLDSNLKNTKYNFVIHKGFKFFANKKRHQYKNSECGMYSIFFITQLLEGNKFKNVVNQEIPDEKMEKFRYIYYRPNFGKKTGLWEII